MIERIRTRDAFVRLRREGRRVRIDPLWCSFVLDSALSSPHVAFAIGRPVGTAVVRNRLRRRVRALLADVGLPPGWYLVGASPSAGSATFDELAQSVDALAKKATAAGTTTSLTGASSVQSVTSSVAEEPT